MKDTDIIKALECCRNAERENASKHCLDCPAAQWDIPLESEETDCIDSLLTRTLHLVARQKAEIERLQGFADNMEYCANHALDDLEKEKAEAIKEFAERLKGKIHDSIYRYWNDRCGGYYLAEDVDVDIDVLVDEMVGERE